MSLPASKGQVGQGTTKKDPEVVSSPKKKGTVSGQKNIKAATKLLQEGPALVEEEAALTFVPVIEETIPQQVIDLNRSVELLCKRVGEAVKSYKLLCKNSKAKD